MSQLNLVGTGNPGVTTIAEAVSENHRDPPPAEALRARAPNATICSQRQNRRIAADQSVHAGQWADDLPDESLVSASHRSVPLSFHGPCSEGSELVRRFFE